MVNRLHDDNQLNNIDMDSNNNIKANKLLENYIDKLDDFEKFEIRKYL